MALAAVAVGMLLGAATQRITGLGFALVATPFVVLALGPRDAVGLIMVTGATAAAGMIWPVRHYIDWPRVAVLAPFSLVGAAPGTYLLLRAEPRLVEICIGVLLVLSLATTAIAPAGAVRPRLQHLGYVGLLSGFTTGAAALGGPPLAIYQRLSAWPPHNFAATLQPVFVVVSVPILVGRVAAGESWAPDSSPIMLIVGFVAMVVGLWIGNRATGRVPTRATARAVMAIAVTGAVLTVVRAVA